MHVEVVEHCFTILCHRFVNKYYARLMNIHSSLPCSTGSDKAITSSPISARQNKLERTVTDITALATNNLKSFHLHS